MAATDAIKDERDLVRMEVALEGLGQDYYDTWKVGINMGLRISDLLNLKFSDIEHGLIKLKEGKTSQQRIVKVNKNAATVIERRRSENPNDVYIFQTKSLNTKSKLPMPMSRSTIGKGFKKAAAQVPALNGLTIGTHTLRKSRGYKMFNEGVPVSVISHFFNHSSEKVTRTYIGITKQDIQQTYDDFEM